MPVTTFDPSEGVSPEQQAAEAAALEQGEKIAQALEEDKARRYAQEEASNEDVALIGGKFKSQDDLLKAYQELQAKLGRGEEGEPEEAEEEAPESEETPEVEEEEPGPSEAALSRAAEEYSKGGQLSEESIEALSQLDSKELIKAYVDFYSKNAQQQQVAQLQAAEQQAIVQSVGGQEAYGEMVAWAAQNLDPAEVDAFNNVTNSGNAAAIKFAVEALNNRYKAAEGYEAPLVTGRKAKATSDSFRSHAELSRAIADPRYSTDPAYRADVEAKLARSQNLL